MKNNILTGSFCTPGILLPQITFAEIQNDKVSQQTEHHLYFSRRYGYGDLSC